MRKGPSSPGRSAAARAKRALGSLEGKVAGARLINSSGAPGGEPTIRLRSATALTSPSACSSQPCPATEAPGPLIIVDGTITRHGLADINSEDIERVEVVKGAAASSLYGSDAANGVVQVFTKRGERVPDGKLVAQVRNEYSQSFRPKVIPTAPAGLVGGRLLRLVDQDAGGGGRWPAVLAGAVRRSVHQPVRPESGRHALPGADPSPVAARHETALHAGKRANHHPPVALHRVG